MNPDVDAYIQKSDNWPAEMAALRPILIEGGLTEGIKWNKPCYAHGDDNIAILQEMKHFLALMFFKGALLEDPQELLVSNGPNSRSAMRLQFTSVDDVHRLSDTVRDFVQEAIDIEEAGLEVGPAPEPVWADELQVRLDEDDAFREAFQSLTPGRRREYNLHFSDAKQAKTRESRIEKCTPKILAGKGFRDR